MDDVSAHDVCHQLLYQLRMFNLHFAISETPHSVQIMMRKRFLRDSKGPATFFLKISALQDYEILEHQNHLLNTEISKLKEENEMLQSQNKSSSETVEILEEKLAKVEAAAFKTYEDKNRETHTLKYSLRNLKNELENTKKDMNTRNKLVKEKEKENYKLGQKNENLVENIRKLKSEISSLRTEIKNFEKQQRARIKKAKDASTSIVLGCSAVASATKSKFHMKKFPPKDKPNTNNANFIPLNFDTSHLTENSPIINSSPVAVVPVSDNSSCTSDCSFSPTTSMVANWIPLTNYSPRNPGSLSSMVTHCAKLPSPGDTFLSMEEVLCTRNEEMV